MSKKTCFVVMGFGEKPDLATGRTLDLDKTYRIIIRRAVEDAGLECIRADDVIHSGTIDAPMYRLLLEADIVIADLSTSNANAIYELGVRHALRPYTTIVIAEKQFRFPFDLGHVLIRPYEHLGKGIDAEEAERVRGELTRAITTLLEQPDVDSPVYTFLPHLEAWMPVDDAAPPAAPPPAAVPAPAPGGGTRSAPPAGAAPEAEAGVGSESGAGTGSGTGGTSVTELMERFQEARARSDWPEARRSLDRLLERRPSDPYLKQQLALATYKSKEPDAVSALQAAKGIMEELQPRVSTDPETLGLWGALHKRLWELQEDRAALDESIWAYEKGYYLRDDHYNGINLAFLLNVRASVSPPREAIADTVLAERTRRHVVGICRSLLEAGIRDDEGELDRVQMFWVKASLVEALLGSGQRWEADALRAKVAAEAPEGWMAASMNEQLAKLEALLAATPPVPAGGP